MKGAIVINPFGLPGACVHQANRMKEEFNKLNVDCEIVTDGYLRNKLVDGKLLTSFTEFDFVVFFDKDKYLSDSLSKLGVKLFNSHEAIRVCDDKGETYLALSNSGVKMPDTVFGALCYKKECYYSEEAKEKIIKTLGLPLIVKESYGSMGNGVHLAKTKQEFDEIIEKVKVKPHFFQKYLSKKKGVDIRAIVIGGKVVASMERCNENDFRSNIAIGGKGKKIELTADFKEVAEKTAKILGLEYCGVDLLYGENGEPVVCEVNSNAFMEGIESVTGINVAGAYAKHIIENI